MKTILLSKSVLLILVYLLIISETYIGTSNLLLIYYSVMFVSFFIYVPYSQFKKQYNIIN
jgi:hypothetical protein